MNEEEIKQVTEMNKIISTDNDTINATIDKTKEALSKVNENIGKIKTYIDQQINTIQNTYAHKTLYKTQKSLIDTQTKITDAIGQLTRETERPNTKIYTELYMIPEEQTNEQKEEQKTNQL